MNASTGPAAIGVAVNPARSVRRVRDLDSVNERERAAMEAVEARYAFKATDYYLGLIDWSDPNDPLRRLVIPHTGELNEWGDLDASDEASITQRHGVQHKYADTALLLVTNNCASLCRYCFRKRLFINDNNEVSPDLTEAIGYIGDHLDITDVLLTGGDPLILPTRRLGNILDRLRGIEHVKVIRIGSKTPAFNPRRINDDPGLHELLRGVTRSGKRIYFMAHFDHSRELTREAVRAIELLQESGVVCMNQCPIIRGVNDDPAVLQELYRRLTWIGCAPYYLFQGRPTKGNAMYRVPIVEAYDIFHEAVKDLSGLAKRARFVMSHATGKIEITGVDRLHIYMRYQRAKNPADRERFMIFHRDDTACWLDDLVPVDGLMERDTVLQGDGAY